MLHAIINPTYITALAGLVTAIAGLVSALRARSTANKAKQSADNANRQLNGSLDNVAAQAQANADKISINRADIDALQKAFSDFFGLANPPHAAPPTSGHPTGGAGGGSL